ncbi:MAG TPA: hypothetical protein VEO00_07145 [Actinomycetota bacterium]|nr:hypothetical protein [Actinomycetota bacterium]
MTGPLGVEVIELPGGGVIMAILALLIGAGLIALAYWVLPRPIASYVAGIGGFVLLALVVVLGQVSPVVPALLAAAVVFGAVAWLVRTDRRATAIGRFAAANGLTHARRDARPSPFRASGLLMRIARRIGTAALLQGLGPGTAVTDADFRLFGVGDGRRAANVVTGAWRGAAVVEADLRWWDTKGYVLLIPLRRARRNSVVLVDLPVTIPRAAAIREDRARLIDKVLTHDVDLDLEAFNRAYVTKAADREFAFALFDQRLMQWLLDRPTLDGLEVNGSRALLYCRRLPPADLPWLLDTARDFLERIPRVVRTRYGADGATTITGEVR